MFCTSFLNRLKFRLIALCYVLTSLILYFLTTFSLSTTIGISPHHKPGTTSHLILPIFQTTNPRSHEIPQSPPPHSLSKLHKTPQQNSLPTTSVHPKHQNLLATNSTKRNPPCLLFTALFLQISFSQPLCQPKPYIIPQTPTLCSIHPLQK